VRNRSVKIPLPRYLRLDDLRQQQVTPVSSLECRVFHSPLVLEIIFRLNDSDGDLPPLVM